MLQVFPSTAQDAAKASSRPTQAVRLWKLCLAEVVRKPQVQPPRRTWVQVSQDLQNESNDCLLSLNVGYLAFLFELQGPARLSFDSATRSTVYDWCTAVGHHLFCARGVARGKLQPRGSCCLEVSTPDIMILTCLTGSCGTRHCIYPKQLDLHSMCLVLVSALVNRKLLDSNVDLSRIKASGQCLVPKEARSVLSLDRFGVQAC